MRVLLCAVVLALSWSPSAMAEGFGFDMRKLNKVDVDRALKGAKLLADKGKGKASPVAGKAPSTDLMIWIGEVAEEETRKGVQAMEANLKTVGYKGDVVEAWTQDLYRILLAHDAVKRKLVGKDASKIYKKLRKAKGKRLAVLQYQAALASVPADDAAAVKPFAARIDALVAQARKARR
jgi:hypothetical protein